MRLDRESYLTVQGIYYPGFTFGGISEPIAAILTLCQLFLLPAGSREFRLTLMALVGLLGMQAVYWMVTHPVNRYWVKNISLGTSGSKFFIADRSSAAASTADDWKFLRNPMGVLPLGASWIRNIQLYFTSHRRERRPNLNAPHG